MKKTIIAGAASLALAALPIVSTFAVAPETNLVDTITVSIGESCTLSRTSGEGEYEATMVINDINNSVGTSTFSVSCNNASGFRVSATPTALDGPGTDITYSTENPAAGVGTWTAARTTAGSNIAATSGVLMSANGITTTPQTETVTYKVATATNQAEGAYEGTMTYVLHKNA